MSKKQTVGPEIHKLKWTEKFLFAVLGKLVKAWQASLSFRVPTELQSLKEEDRGKIILFWHNRLFMNIALFLRLGVSKGTMHGLVSASKDGAKLAAFMEALDVVPIRGSSSRRARQATVEVIKAVRTGGLVSITVDGPRGPCYQAQPGAAFLARQTASEVFLVSSEPESYWQLRSWDRFIVPKPFSHIHIKVKRLPSPTDAMGKAGREALEKAIQSNLELLTVIK